MKCDVHPDRGGILFVDLPSIGVRRWGCFECRANLDKKMLEYKPPRPRWIHDPHMPQWERELRTGNPGETLGMEGREAGHAYLTRIARDRSEK